MNLMSRVVIMKLGGEWGRGGVEWFNIIQLNLNSRRLCLYFYNQHLNNMSGFKLTNQPICARDLVKKDGDHQKRVLQKAG